MGEIFPVPRIGDVFHDVRDGDRTMRISSHGDRGLVVSLWVGAHCRASFRMAAGDVDRLMSTLDEIRVSLGIVAQPAAQGPAVAAAMEPAAGTDREPPVEQTGDVSGPVNLGGRTHPPVLRVA
jgi:hypothetical protein